MQTLIALLYFGQSLVLPQAYTAALPDGWLSLGAPQLELVTDTGRFVIQLQPDCTIGPDQNVEVFYGSGNVGSINPVGDVADQCHIGFVSQISDTPCAQNDAGLCDISAQ